MLPAEVHVLSYQNHFCNYKSFDERKAKGEIRDVKLVQQEHAIRCKATKEKSQVQEQADEILKLVDGFLLQVCDFRLAATHLTFIT